MSSTPENGGGIELNAQTLQARWWSRLWTGVLSLFFPGMGQAFRGAYRRGFAFAVSFVVAIGLYRLSVYALAWLPSGLVYALMIVAIVAASATVIFGVCDAFRFKTYRPTRFRAWWKRWPVYAAVVVVVSLQQIDIGPLRWEPFSIPSMSMEPTILVGDQILVEDGFFDMHDPQPGDLAVFKLPCDFPLLAYTESAFYRKRCDTSSDFIKRITALPGDQVQITRGVLSVNGVPRERGAEGSYRFTGDLKPKVFAQYSENTPAGARYTIALAGDDQPLENTNVFTVPPDRYFVLGDHRDESVDSREPTGGVGFVPRANLIGRPALVFFSTDGSASWWQVWTWPCAIRWGRLGQALP